MSLQSIDYDGVRTLESFVQSTVLASLGSWHLSLSHLIHVYLAKFSFLYPIFSLL